MDATALLIECILLENFKAIYDANEICSLALKIGFDIFVEVVVGPARQLARSRSYSSLSV